MYRKVLYRGGVILSLRNSFKRINLLAQLRNKRYIALRRVLTGIYIGKGMEGLNIVA